MKRIVLSLTIAYIIGIIIGLYETISIILFLFLLIFAFIIIKKLFITNTYKMLIFFIFIVLGFFLTKNYNSRWNVISNNIIPNNVVAKVINLEKETKYQATFKIKIINDNMAQNKYVLLKVNVKDKIYKKMKLGAVIVFNGEIEQIETSRNFGGFNYQEYLKSKNIYRNPKMEKWTCKR